MNREITPKQIFVAIEDLLEEKEDLQQRIDKAIEYINSEMFDYMETPDLLEILGGKQ